MIFIIAGICLAVALILTIVVLVIRAERKRRKELADWASKRGFAYFDANQEAPLLSTYKAWGPGYGHRNFDGYEGNFAGTDVQMWQHQSRTKSKDSENIHNFTILKIRMPISVPNTHWKREHFGHKVFDALGGEDIDFESDEFSRKFWVKGDDRRFAYDLFHARMMEYMLTAPKAHWQWQGAYLILHVSGAFQLKRIQPLLQAAEGFLPLLPKHLLREGGVSA